MKPKGFTLIEMLVAVALFSTVMVIALGTLLAISTSDRKAQSLKAVINNLNFAVDSMSRAVRTGTNWTCSSGTCNGINDINFVPANGVGRVYYRLESLVNDPSNAATVCGQTAPYVGCLVKSTDGTTWLPLTSPEVIVNDYSASSPASYLFYMVGQAIASTPDTTQPKLVMTLSGYVRLAGGAATQASCATAGTQCSVFHLQTSVTQRIYDI